MEMLRVDKDDPDKRRYASWFHSKWDIPAAEYENSMGGPRDVNTGIPRWYVVTEGDAVIGGAGVIENDFHERKDLTPNISSLYVEKEYRGRGIGGKLLQHICTDMKEIGIGKLYLVTELSSFYERYGWRFLCTVQGDDGCLMRMYLHEQK